MKVQFTLGQRMFIYNAFLGEFRQHKVYDAVGHTLRPLICDGVKLLFIPFKAKMETEWPPLEVEHVEKKDSEGNVIQDAYSIEIKININPVLEGNYLKLKKIFPKSDLANR